MMYQSPYIIEQSQMNMTQLDVFSRLMRDRIIFISDAIDDTMASIVNAQLLWLSNENDAKDIQVYINSPGGSIASGNSILDTFEYIESDSLAINTIALGTAASMASILLVAGTPGHRVSCCISHWAASVADTYRHQIWRLKSRRFSTTRSNSSISWLRRLASHTRKLRKTLTATAG